METNKGRKESDERYGEYVGTVIGTHNQWIEDWVRGPDEVGWLEGFQQPYCILAECLH